MSATACHSRALKPFDLNRDDDAIKYAHQAKGNPWMGEDRHGHYEFFPYVNLAHWRLYPHVGPEDQAKIAEAQALVRRAEGRLEERSTPVGG